MWVSCWASVSPRPKINFSLFPTLYPHDRAITHEKLFIELNGRGKVDLPFNDLSTCHTWRRCAWCCDCRTIFYFPIAWAWLIMSFYWSAVLFHSTISKLWNPFERECIDSTIGISIQLLSVSRVRTSSNRHERTVVSSLFWVFNDWPIGFVEGKATTATSHSRLLTFHVEQFVNLANWINVMRRGFYESVGQK